MRSQNNYVNSSILSPLSLSCLSLSLLLSLFLLQITNKFNHRPIDEIRDQPQKEFAYKLLVDHGMFLLQLLYHMLIAVAP